MATEIMEEGKGGMEEKEKLENMLILSLQSTVTTKEA